MMRFMDGFDHHNTTTLTSYGKWDTLITGVGIGSTSAKQRFSGSGQYLASDQASRYVEKALGSNEASGVFGMALRMDVSGSNLYQFLPIILYDGTTAQIFLKMNTDRTISICRTTTGTVLGTSTYVFPVDQYVYLEWKWKIANSISTNDVIVYADGVDILNLAATTDTQGTSNAYVTKLRLHGDTALLNVTATATYYDDFYWLDLTGSVNNAPKGPVRIVTLSPSATGNSSQLVNNSGNSTNNYQRVDEIPPTDDTDYVETSTPGNKDTYGFGDLPATVSSVYAVAINTGAKKTDAAARTFKSQVRISSTNYENAEQTLTTNYKNFQDIMEVSPATSSPFTASEVNGAEYGTKCHA